jgi:hypothetical protein
MNKPHAAAATWRPDNLHDREAILSELRQVLASPHFCNSKRYPALLEFVVDHVLTGNTEMLKERTLGVEVFGRRPDYDTNSDTIVRYTASEVRKRLLLYYSELEHTPAIRISLPPGSYIPEFLHEGDQLQEVDHKTGVTADDAAGVYVFSDTEKHKSVEISSPASAAAPLIRPLAVTAEVGEQHSGSGHRTILLRALLVVIIFAVIGGSWFAYRQLRPQTAINDFWAPVLQGQRSMLVCTGSVTFSQRPNYSGTTTAGKDIDYPFVSMQIASAINQISGTIDQAGDSTQLVSSASTSLTTLRDHSVILLGGYNNLWTMRLLDPLRFHFSTGPGEAILDRTQPQMQWTRDRSLPYSSADDYAIVARFRNPGTNGWVVALAGIGRNGTEAAAHFATNPRYMQSLRDWMGRDFSDRNIEAVLKVNVIEGRTGAPSILAVHVW